MKLKSYVPLALTLFLMVQFQSSQAMAAKSLTKSFEDAAREFGVPVELLMGVSYTTTAWHNARGFDAHSAREFGVMGLRGHSIGPSLAGASLLLELSEETVRDDLEQNIRGGAALLVSYAREANHGVAPDAELTLDTLPAWWKALGAYSGVAEPRHQDLYAAQVFETLDQGAEGRAESGEMIHLYPSPLPSVLGDWITDARAAYRRQVEAMSTQTDYSGASWVAACSSNYSNYSRGPSDISYIIVHKIEGSYSGCISWFQNCSSQVSAHYVVSSGGAVTQMVLEEDVAWHAGNWDYNLASVGIEHEGYTYTDDVGDSEYQGSADLARNICDRNGIPKTRSYIIGHNEVPGATHTDPGPYWDWDYYMHLIGGTGGGGDGGGGDDDDDGGGDGSTGNLVGLIKAGDIYDGTPVGGAVVTLDNGDSTTTDSSGYYEFSNITAATYRVTADAQCYAPNSTTKTMQAGIDNWASIALFSDGSCGGGDDDDDGGSCRAMSPELVDTRVHAASVNPLDRLPLRSVGFYLGMGLFGILFLRRRSR